MLFVRDFGDGGDGNAGDDDEQASELLFSGSERRDCSYLRAKAGQVGERLVIRARTSGGADGAASAISILSVSTKRATLFRILFSCLAKQKEVCLRLSWLSLPGWSS